MIRYHYKASLLSIFGLSTLALAQQDPRSSTPGIPSLSGEGEQLRAPDISIQETIDQQDETEEIIETVRLGGENEESERANQGVSLAEEYTPTAEDNDDPESLQPPPPTLPAVNNAQAVVDDTVSDDPSIHDPSRVAYAQTRLKARTMSMSIPAPRGLITDRHGATLASSEVAYQPSILFGQLNDASDAKVLEIAKEAQQAIKKLGLEVWEKSDKQILDHYRDRAWLPLPLSGVIRVDEYKRLRAKLDDIPYIQLTALYVRRYPHKATAAHILGYTGIEAKLPTGPINHNDPIFERHVGRAGLEKSFNEQLMGSDGVWRLMFNEQGEKILDALQIKPRPGGSLVTTIDLEWQQAAVQALRKHTNGRGAFVMVDCHTGEVVVMASVPSFDPNVFIPFITQAEYDKLRLDSQNPLVSRAFAGVYPPASTFKTITVAAALRYGIIAENTYIYCPYSVRIGDYEFRNHSSFSGSINCVTALVLSNNPFLYQIAATRENRLGAARLCGVARRFGLGSSTGLPIPDKAGNVPDENWMYRNYGRGFKQGDAANLAIGQGALLATPLQIAHAMTGIANGHYLPKLQLIRQVHDRDGNVIFQFKPEVQENLQDLQKALTVVRKGMHGVVNGGTGRRAAISYVSNAGKTGTAQWGKLSDDSRLAWFAGYLPADKPRYAYVALYEGSPGQRISGGVFAASIVKAFFENVRESFQRALLKDPFEFKPKEKKMEVDIEAYTEDDVEAAREAEEEATTTQVENKIKREQNIRTRQQATQRRSGTQQWGRQRRRR